MKNNRVGPLVVATLSTVAAGPGVRTWLLQRQNLDLPNERSAHTVPTPRGGGLACLAGGAAGSLWSRLVGQSVSATWALGSAALATVGRLDDAVGLPAAPRLGVQLVTGALVGAMAGGAVGAAAGAFVVPAIVNAVNFMDGINGISGGVAGSWGLTVSADPKLPGSIRAQAAVTAGMGFGFLPYNIPKASMFLGDVGSYLLGASIGISIVEAAFRKRRFDLVGAARVLAPLAPYLADTGGTLLRRALKGESVMTAHRDHAYQRLVRVTDWPHWAVSALVVGVSALCGASARSRRGAVVIVPSLVLYLSAPSIYGSVGFERCGLSKRLPGSKP